MLLNCPLPTYWIFNALLSIFIIKLPLPLPLSSTSSSKQLYPKTRAFEMSISSAIALLLFSVLLLTSALSLAARPEASTSRNGNKDDGFDGFFGPGGGFGIPGFGKGWGKGIVGGGYGGGYGGPNGGYGKGGVIRNPVVCREKGPCYNKKVTCPARCFTSYSRSGKGFGSGGGGGSCTIDCKKKCTAYC